jgi:hypothetical protein
MERGLDMTMDVDGVLDSEPKLVFAFGLVFWFLLRYYSTIKGDDVYSSRNNRCCVVGGTTLKARSIRDWISTIRES